MDRGIAGFKKEIWSSYEGAKKGFRRVQLRVRKGLRRGKVVFRG
jgi:hypothetical protein